MKKHIYKFTLVFILMISWGCDDYLDVNQDPNVLNSLSEAKVLLPTAELNLANTLMGWDLGFGAGFWSEYWTQSYNASQFKTLCEYDETSFSNAYTSLTAGVLMDLKTISNLSKDNNKGYYFVSEALSIYTWQMLTDIWGDVPYTEALRGNEGIDNPKFDNDQEIYADLITRIDQLIAMDLTGASIDKKFDFIFAGDMNQWKLFANSLKLKLELRQSETPGYNNASLLSFVANNEFLTSNAAIPGSTWSDDQEGKRHPMREFQEGSANYLTTNVIASKNFLDYLSNNNDPRLATLFTAPTGGHKGAFFGDFDSTEDTDNNGTKDSQEKYSIPSFQADMDLMLMSSWEVSFNIAEVYARSGDNVNAKTYYDMAVTASVEQHGAVNNITTAGGYAEWSNGTVEEDIKQIAVQKWVANANYQHIESFLERNRTRYPVLNPIVIEDDRNYAFLNFPNGELTVSVAGRAKTNGRLPQSPTYPASILTRNVNAPAQKPDLLQKVWWNQKAGN